MGDSSNGYSSGSQSSSQGCPACIAKCKARLAQLKKEASDLVNDHGDPEKNGSEINRKITQKYAEMYSSNPQLYWAGAATYVSKQAGCNMRHAEKIKKDSGVSAGIGKIGGALTGAGDPKAAAGATERMLVKGNQAIFSDIYPQYKLFEEDPDCVTKYGKEVLPSDSKNMIDGFEKYREGDLKGAMMDHAYYEQKNILQDRVFDNSANSSDKALFKKSVEANESAWTKLDFIGYSKEAQVSFTADCTSSNPDFISKAPGDFTNFKSRWNTAVNTLNKYDSLMTKEPTIMNQGIQTIGKNMSDHQLPVFK